MGNYNYGAIIIKKHNMTSILTIVYTIISVKFLNIITLHVPSTYFLYKIKKNYKKE